MPVCTRTAHCILLCFFSLLMFGSLGCDSRETGVATTGSVTLDGEPLPNGLIHFEPVDGAGASASRRIEGGEFDFPPNARMKPGKYKVSIRAIPPDSAEDADAAMNGGAQPKFHDPVPAKYNDRTELVAEVTEEGPNTFQYDLTSP